MADSLLKSIPFVLDFLDIDNEELLHSGILNDSEYDYDIITVIQHAMNQRSNETIKTEENSHETYNISKQVPLFPELQENHRQHFRMNRDLFNKLLGHLENASTSHQPSTRGGRQELSQETRLYITLNYLGSRKSVRYLSRKYQVSESTVLMSVRRMVSRIYQAMQTFIKWPDDKKLLEIADGFSEISGMPRVVGVIDVSHINVRAPVVQRDYYANPQGRLSIILQAVCDHEMKFLHCCTGWPGSVDDTSVFEDSDLYMDVSSCQSKFFPIGHYLVADSAYHLQDWLITPFDENEALDESQVKFNQTHKLTTEIMQKTFAHLKARFPRLHYIDMVEMEDIVKVILVCCALHNFCLDGGDAEMFNDTEAVWEGETSTGIDFNAHREEGVVRRTEIMHILSSNYQVSLNKN